MLLRLYMYSHPRTAPADQTYLNTQYVHIHQGFSGVGLLREFPTTMFNAFKDLGDIVKGGMLN